MVARIEIWDIDLAASAHALLELDDRDGWLSPQDRARTSGARERRACLVAVQLLIASRGLETRGHAFVRGLHGKPSLAGCPAHFSLSHATGRALVALADHPVGVDLELPRETGIEDRRRRLMEDAAARLCPDAPLPAPGSPMRFLQAWTRLEALAKAEGCGIGRLLTMIGALGAGRQVVVGDVRPEFQILAGAYSVRDLALTEGRVGAVASTQHAFEVGLQRFPPGLEALQAWRNAARRACAAG